MYSPHGPPQFITRAFTPVVALTLTFALALTSTSSAPIATLVGQACTEHSRQHLAEVSATSRSTGKQSRGIAAMTLVGGEGHWQRCRGLLVRMQRERNSHSPELTCIHASRTLRPSVGTRSTS